MTKSEIIDHYISEVANGMDFQQVRNQLSKAGFEQEEISQMIKVIDNHLIHVDLSKSNRSVKREYFWVGVFLFSLGIISTLITFFGIVNMGSNFLIVYGPIIAGLGLMVYGRSEFKAKKFKRSGK